MTDAKIYNWVAVTEKGIIEKDCATLTFEQGDSSEKKMESAYKNRETQYSKFYKMDLLSKLGFVSAEYLLKDLSIDKSDVAIVLSNRNASLETDMKHQRSIQNTEEYLPSPATFVYTLPNIVNGEICIRHGIKGENIFFITEKFDAKLLWEYTGLLFNEAETEYCITGWADVWKGSFFSLFFLVCNTKNEEPQNDLLFTIENINTIFKKANDNGYFN